MRYVADKNIVILRTPIMSPAYRSYGGRLLGIAGIPVRVTAVV